ncbi:hypothetical protein B8V81_0277 [Paenibacillus pasadenensis]|uniref:Uncharacterized protein n=1 Tax=Paenibacillus pasadenensis TaxID=217090 RepID=A0A2N5NCS7_9BACL|nr:hypothetical protein B8V81_0277 [Paenibacillus pasadenensis]
MQIGHGDHSLSGRRWAWREWFIQEAKLLRQQRIGRPRTSGPPSRRLLAPVQQELVRPPS